jgi:hypothetical protein
MAGHGTRRIWKDEGLFVERHNRVELAVFAKGINVALLLQPLYKIPAPSMPFVSGLHRRQRPLCTHSEPILCDQIPSDSLALAQNCAPSESDALTNLAPHPREIGASKLAFFRI